MHKLLRIIDVNLNRSQEGLRVCEDIVRFALNDKALTRSFKTLRHRIRALAKRIDTKKFVLLRSRDVRKDVGKKTGAREGKRKNIRNIFFANIQRAKESLRVLEEITKLVNGKISQNFKKARFRTYELEKKSRVSLETVLHYR